MWRSGVDLWLAWVEVYGVDGPMKTDMVCEKSLYHMQTHTRDHSPWKTH